MSLHTLPTFPSASNKAPQKFGNRLWCWNFLMRPCKITELNTFFISFCICIVPLAALNDSTLGYLMAINCKLNQRFFYLCRTSANHLRNIIALYRLLGQSISPRDTYTLMSTLLTDTRSISREISTSYIYPSVEFDYNEVTLLLPLPTGPYMSSTIS